MALEAIPTTVHIWLSCCTVAKIANWWNYKKFLFSLKIKLQNRCQYNCSIKVWNIWTLLNFPKLWRFSVLFRIWFSNFICKYQKAVSTSMSWKVSTPSQSFSVFGLQLLPKFKAKHSVKGLVFKISLKKMFSPCC